jgi:FKBP-type peptidyl-prolyl cis-trans isomerase
MRRRDIFVQSGSLTALVVMAATSCGRQTVRVAPTLAPAKVVKTGSGLVYEVIQPGTGAGATPGQTVLIHESLTVDGKLIFSSREKGAPVKFLLGAKQVIPGVDETVAGMRVGERRKATIPPELDGRTFDPAFIRADADRYYDIELVEILK